jgi:hypothetical protein
MDGLSTAIRRTLTADSWLNRDLFDTKIRRGQGKIGEPRKLQTRYKKASRKGSSGLRSGNEAEK